MLIFKKELPAASQPPLRDVTPSQDDIMTTRRVIEVGKLLGISCLDYIIIGGGNGSYFTALVHKICVFPAF